MRTATKNPVLDEYKDNRSRAQALLDKIKEENMNARISEIIDTLNEGQEVTIILANGDQMTGLFRGTDDEQIILRAKSGNVPDLGWDISVVADIIPHDAEPAGDIVTVDISDVKTGRKVAVNIDVSGEEAVVKVEFIPAIHKDESGWYIHFASKFMQALVGGEDIDGEAA